jgi:hypothetical protein
MSKLIKWGLLSLLAIALLIKLSLWLSVRSIMTDATDRMSSAMVIRYGGITSSFDGRVGLEKVDISIPAMRDSLRIEHAELKFDGLGELLRFKERLAEGKFPEKMAVSLKGLALDVHGPFMQQLHDTPAERSVFTAMSEVVCGKVRTIGTAELLDMGYRTFETDGEFSYHFQPGAQQLTFNLNSDTRDVGELRMSVAVANMSEKPGDLLANPPRVQRLTVEIGDNQYQRKVQDYCSGKQGMDRTTYLQAAVGQFDKVFRSQRIALDQPVLDAYARYLDDPQSLRLEFSPSEGLIWDGLQFYEADGVLALLRPVLLVNQQVVEPLGFAWVDPNKSSATAIVQVADDSAPDTLAVARLHGREEFVSVASLADHVGKRLRFITHDGMYYQGVLTKVGNNKAYISIQAGNGSAQMSLRLEKIDQVKVRF